MSFPEFFENLCHEINDSRTGRRARIQEIRTDVHEMMGEIRTRIGGIFSHTHDLLGAFKREHQDMAKGLREQLHDFKREHQDMAKGLREQLHDFADDLRRGGEIFRGNRAASFPKEGRQKKRA